MNQQSAFARQQTHQLPPGAAASGPPMTIDGALMSPTTQGVLSDDEDDDDDEKHAAPPLPEKSRNSVAAVPPAPVKLSRGDKAGVQLRKLIPASLACRLLLLTVFLEAVIDIAIQANILWRFQLEVDSAEESSDTTSSALEANKRRLPVYLYIFVTAHIVQLGLTVYAIRTRNTIQVIGLAIFNGLFVIYAGIEIEEIRNILGNTTPAANAQTTHNLLTLPLNVLTAIVIAVVAASEIAVVVLTWFIWREFGWRIYRFLGADLRIRRFYLQYQIFECICCFSFFFFAGFGVQVSTREGAGRPVTGHIQLLLFQPNRPSPVRAARPEQFRPGVHHHVDHVPRPPRVARARRDRRPPRTDVGHGRVRHGPALRHRLFHLQARPDLDRPRQILHGREIAHGVWLPVARHDHPVHGLRLDRVAQFRQGAQGACGR